MMIHRRAIRAIIITPDRDVLLMRIRPPEGGASFWIAPGGGIEADETPEDALKRELAEELGLTDFEPGPTVWLRHHIFNWDGRRISQKEEYRVVLSQKFEPVIADAVEAKVVECFRWWPIVDLPGADERFTPLSLANILTSYLRDGPPEKMLYEEVLID
jgi:8-oxo-dGTP pyrophosphatase MutT (NUDIX family)